MRLNGLIAASAGVVLLGACSQDGNVKLNGRFAGHSDKKIYLEQVLPGNQRIVDSTTLSKKGAFRMTVTLPDDQPTLYNLRYNNDVIPLFLSPGESVTVNSIGDVAHNYTVEGSPESERIRELRVLLGGGALTLDSLRSVIVSSDDGDQRRAYTEFIRETQRIMREHLSFIIMKPQTLSSLYALYQRLPGQPYLFNQDNDILYYRMVADSVEKYYPTSPYVTSLRREVSEADGKTGLFAMISEKLAGSGDNYPDLYLPDMYGNKHLLSNLHGNVILLDFWHSTLPSARLNNAEVKKVYDEVHTRGFEVYQVSLDTKKAEWILAIQNQKLPWISVSDLQGDGSPAVRQFNVTKVPTNFLIDRNGKIVARDVYGEDLGKEVRKLL